MLVKKKLRIGLFSLIVVVAVGLLLTVAVTFFNEGIPLVEYGKTFTQGSVFGFDIGMTKKQCLQTIKDKYSSEGYGIRIDRMEGRETDRALAFFDVVVADHWEIDMPGDWWVNDIDLIFEADQLKEIKRTKILFERP
jgi:hypothetical protein